MPEAFPAVDMVKMITCEGAIGLLADSEWTGGQGLSRVVTSLPCCIYLYFSLGLNGHQGLSRTVYHPSGPNKIKVFLPDLASPSVSSKMTGSPGLTVRPYFSLTLLRNTT